MKLNIAQNLRKYRKEQGLTQETLASALGVSSQCISKWECGDGYPDIETLPQIAQFFQITIDELMGNDISSVLEDMRTFMQRVLELEGEEKLLYVRDYYMKYPNNFMVANTLAKTIVYEHRDKLNLYRPMLQKACEMVVNTCPVQQTRAEAIKYMCLSCTDEEFDRWYGMCCNYYNAFKGEILQERLGMMGQYDRCLEREAVNRFYTMCHLLGNRNTVCSGIHETKSVSEFYMNITEAMAEDGVIPEAWRGFYARSCLVTAHHRFGHGNKEEGYRYLERAAELYANLPELSEEVPLDVGNPHFFGGIRLYRKNGGMYGIQLSDGTRELLVNEAFLDAHYVFGHKKADLHRYLIRPHGWEWFDEVRDEERFRNIVTRAEEIAAEE